MAQGFTIELNGSGHPVLVSPDGNRVWMSSTKADSYHVVANVKAALRHAGWRDPAHSQRKRMAPPVVARSLAPSAQPALSIVRATHDEPGSTGETTMQEPRPTDPMQPIRAAHEFAPKPTARRAGGAFAYVSGETVTVLGHEVKLRERADGDWFAMLTDHRYASGRKSFSERGGGKAGLLVKVERYLSEHPGGVAPDRSRKTAAEIGHQGGKPKHTPADHQLAAHVIAEHLPPKPATTAETPASAPKTAAEPTAAPKPSNQAPKANGAAVADPAAFSTWAAVKIIDAEYPIAAALAELDRQVAPAIEALQAAGKTEAAELVRDELAKTPAEAELVRLWNELHNRPRLEHS
jgi:hypothetical protein